MLVNWYVYDNTGAPTFLIGVLDPITEATWQGVLTEQSGMAFGSFMPAATATAWGLLQVTLLSCNDPIAALYLAGEGLPGNDLEDAAHVGIGPWQKGLFTFRFDATVYPVDGGQSEPLSAPAQAPSLDGFSGFVNDDDGSGRIDGVRRASHQVTIVPTGAPGPGIPEIVGTYQIFDLVAGGGFGILELQVRGGLAD